LSASVALKPDIDSVVVLVSGTGSIGMSFTRTEAGFQRTARVGGWGHLLGDDGSGYGIGRDALRKALRAIDARRMLQGAAPALSPLSQAIYDHFKDTYPTSNPDDLLSSIVMPTSGPHPTEDATLGTTNRIAAVAKVVISMAASDDEAKTIVDSGTASLAELVTLLAAGQGIDVSRCGLVLAGGLMQDDFYRGALVDAVTKQLGAFGQVEAVDQPALHGAKLLARDL
jgi:N-acetylmuramic acid 6-phosphate etherase